MPDEPEPTPQLPDPGNPSTADDSAGPPIEDLPDPSNVETRGTPPPGKLLRRGDSDSD